VTLLDYHVIFAIMAAFTFAVAGYLLICLRGQLFRPDLPLPSPFDLDPGVSEMPASELPVSAIRAGVSAPGGVSLRK